MDQISTISELLKLSDSSYRIFDMGRVVTKISKQQFESVEQAMQPYPYPTQGHAHIGIVFWQSNVAAPYIWFVKFPLDERGMLNQGARNHFIAIILEALGKDLSQNPTEKQEELLKENPYNFTPAQYKLASLNSLIKTQFKQKASQYFEHCQLYLSGKLGFENWEGVGIQGLSDFASRIGDKENEMHLLGALPSLPSDVFQPLSHALENQVLPLSIINKLISMAEQTITNEPIDMPKLTTVLRAMSSNMDHTLVAPLITNILNNDKITDLDLLITISGRCWSCLQNIDTLTLYLEKLVKNAEHQVFAAVFQDLIAIPSIRPYLLQCIRSTNRSERLISAFGQIFSALQGK